ncbi:MAG: hypothetical protein LUO93_06430 [Methanomicrobiales archaeon]|nr:hypothetical protein [Methanomicrobiales archaeon]
MFDHCPGGAQLRTPTLSIKRCPQCGEEIEIFSNELKASCGRCGFVIYNDLQTCIQWCRYARECLGEETYRRMMEKKE